MIIIKEGDVKKYTGVVMPWENNQMGIVLHNDCLAQWEWQLQRRNGTEHIMTEGVAAAGLLFPHKDTQSMVLLLRGLADELEKTISND